MSELRRLKQQKGSRRPTAIWWIGAAVVVVLAAVAWIAASGGSDNKSDSTSSSGIEQVRAVQVTGSLPTLAGQPDPAVGTAAPEVHGQSFDGTPVAITNDGKAKIVLFVAHWCPHCQREVPLVVNWLASRKPAIDVYAVSTSTTPDRPNYPPSAWLEDENFKVPTIADDATGTTAKAFGLDGFPYFVAIGSDGKVVTRASGELSTEALDAIVASLKS